jgi:hypothetical protein
MLWVYGIVSDRFVTSIMNDDVASLERAFVSEFLHRALPLVSETCQLGITWSNSHVCSCASFFGLDDQVWLRILDDLGLIQVKESPQTIDGIDDSAHVTPKYKVNVKEITIRSFIDDIGLQGKLELVPLIFQRTAEEQRAKHWMLRIKVTGSEMNPTRPYDAIPVDEKRLKRLHDDLHIESSDSDEDYEPPHSQTQGSTFDNQSTNFTSDYWSGETQQSERERDQVLDSLKKPLATVIKPAYHERQLNGDLLAANRPEELFGALKSLAALVHNQSDTMRRTALPW